MKTRKDPLAGQREAINTGNGSALFWADEGKGCPVEVGEILPVRIGGIEIVRKERVRKKGEWLWRADFVRIYHAKKRDVDPVRVLPGLAPSWDSRYEAFVPEPEPGPGEGYAATNNAAQHALRSAEDAAESKESSVATSERSERAKARHKRSLESTAA